MQQYDNDLSPRYIVEADIITISKKINLMSQV